MCHGSLCHGMNVCHDMKLDLAKDEKQNFEHKQKIFSLYIQVCLDDQHPSLQYF